MTRVASQYQEELPPVLPIVRRFDIEVGRCSQCRRRVQGRHRLETSDALGAAAVQLGPGLASLVVELHTEMRVPLAKVAGLLRTRLGLEVTAGGLVHLLHRTARDAAPVLPGTLPASPQRAGGHARRNGLARQRQVPLAVDVRHPGDHRLRHLPRPRVQGCGHRARDRLRRRGCARRLAGVPALQGFVAPELPQSPASALPETGAEAPPQSLELDGQGRSRPASTFGTAERRADPARSRLAPRRARGPARSAHRRAAAVEERQALRQAPRQRIPRRVPLPAGPVATPPTGGRNRPSGPRWSSARCAAATAPARAPTLSRCSRP